MTDQSTNEHYWPSEEVCRSRVRVWVAALQDNMLAYVGQDCHVEGPDVSPREHWLEAKRRYQLKNNQLSRIAFLTNIDPEGRYRHHPTKNRLPKHVEHWLRYADFLVGVASGVNLHEIRPEHLYASGGAIDEDEVLRWCLVEFASTSTAAI